MILQMRNRNNFVIEIIVLLLLAQVLDIQAGCSWDSDDGQKYCAISCGSDWPETTDQVLRDLERKLDEVDNFFKFYFYESKGFVWISKISD